MNQTKACLQKAYDDLLIKHNKYVIEVRKLFLTIEESRKLAKENKNSLILLFERLHWLFDNHTLVPKVHESEQQ